MKRRITAASAAYVGGLGGLLFLLPLLRGRTLMRDMLISLAPSAVVLLVVFPGMGQGLLCTGFGALAPVLVVLLNFIWGWWPLSGVARHAAEGTGPRPERTVGFSPKSCGILS